VDHRAPLEWLLTEYTQTAEDWRTRDRYKQEKFMGSVFVFSAAGFLLSEAVPTLAGRPWGCLAMAGVFVTLAFYTFVMLFSVTKDQTFRNGSELLMRSLAAEIERITRDDEGTPVSAILARLHAAHQIDIPKNYYAFPRRIKPTRQSGLLPKVGLGEPITERLTKLHTAQWLSWFYVLLLVGFVALAVFFTVRGLSYGLGGPG